MDFKTGHFNIF